MNKLRIAAIRQSGWPQQSLGIPAERGERSCANQEKERRHLHAATFESGCCHLGVDCRQSFVFREWERKRIIKHSDSHTAGARNKKLIGIQVGAVSFVDEGVDKVLDIFQSARA
jgi:hypothetical protein